MAGRYKLSDQGVYYDPNDTGPDQASPDQIAQYQQSQQAPSAPSGPQWNYQYDSSGNVIGDTGSVPHYPGQTVTPAPPSPSPYSNDWNYRGGMPQPAPSTSGGSAPPNNPNAAPEPDHIDWGSAGFDDPGTARGRANADYYNLYTNYWAPDRHEVLAAARAQALQGTTGLPGGITFNPGPNTPSNPYYNNTGVAGGGTPPSQLPGSSSVPTGGAVPNGFDATKWNDPTKHDPKYDAGHMLAAGQSLEQIGQYIQQTYPGYKYLGGDKILGPDGATYDFAFGSGAGINAPQWTQVSGGADSGGGGTGSIAGLQSGGAGNPGASFGTAGAPTNSAFSDQVRQLLMQQIGGLSGPVTAQDPQIAAEMQAQDAALTRNQRDQRAAAAERMAMNGLLNGGQSSGAFDQELASEFENKGQQLTGLQAQLFGREIQQRRQLVLSYLQSALQSGDAESARQLQAYLAQLDNAYRYAALAQNQGQFNDTFGLNAAQFQYQKNRDLAQYGGGY